MAPKTDIIPAATPTKLIVLSAPRSGTQGLYFALQILGYKPYHMTEAIKVGGSSLAWMINGYDGELGEGKRYTRADFDKWFAGYDVIIEMPFWMLTSTLEAYPDANYLLVERSPEQWAKSIENTVFKAADNSNSFPMSFFRHFERTVYGISEFTRKFQKRSTGGWAGTPRGHDILVNHYKEYVASVKRLVPPEQLHVIRLEDGYGWKAICPYLGKPVPDVPWPKLNSPEEFKEFVFPLFKKAIFRGMTFVTTVSMCVVGLGWALRTGRLQLPFTIIWH